MSFIDEHKHFLFPGIFVFSFFFWLTLFGVIDVTRAWTNPVGNPPAGSGGVSVSGGEVGIGTTSPQGKLDVSGGISIGSYAGVSVPPTGGIIASGFVGIGKSNPSAELDVEGTIKGLSLKFPTLGASFAEPGYVITSIDTEGRTEWRSLPPPPPNGFVGGSAAIGYIARFVSSTAVGTSTIYETDGKVGLNTVLPDGKFDVHGETNIGTPTGGPCCAGYYTLSLNDDGSNAPTLQFHDQDVAEGQIVLRTINGERAFVFESTQGPMKGKFTGDLLVEGDVIMGSNIGIAPVVISSGTVYAAQAIYQSGRGASEQVLYADSVNRYIVEAPAADVGRVVPLNPAIVSNFCRDKDGCTVSIQMINWDTMNYPSLVSNREERLFIAEEDVAGILPSRTWWQIQGTTENGYARGLDGDSVTHEWRVWDCILTDAENSTDSSNGRTDNAGQGGFGLLNVSGGSFSDITTMCRVVLFD